MSVRSAKRASALVEREDRGVCQINISSYLSTEILEMIGRTMDSLHTVGLWNQVLALRHNNNRPQPGQMRSFSSAVEMIQQDMIEDDPTSSFGEALLFRVIHNTFRHQCPRTRTILNLMVKRYPAAMERQNSRGDTPLHTALTYTNDVDDLVFLLLDGDFDSGKFDDTVLTIQNMNAETPLSLASSNQTSADLLKMLIDTTESVLRTVCRDFLTPLQTLIYYATDNIDMEAIAALVSRVDLKHPSGVLLNQDVDDETALHIALLASDHKKTHDLINKLIPVLIDPEQKVLLVKNRKSMPSQPGENTVFETDTPLHLALKKHMHLKTLRLLIDRHNNVLCLRNSANLQGIVHNDTPLHLAIKDTRKINVIQALVDPEGLVHLIRNRCGDMPLHTALRKCTQHGANTRLHKQNIILFLMRAAMAAHDDFILQVGQHGDTALHVAIKNDAPLRVVQALVRADCRMLLMHNAEYAEDEDVDEQADMPLHIGLRRTMDWAVLRLLIDVDDDVLTKQNCNGDTPLHVAIKTGHPLENIQHLVAAGAEALVMKNSSTIYSEERRGDTPLHLALRDRMGLDIIQLLVDSDQAVLWMPNHVGDLPIHVALSESLSMEHIDFLLGAVAGTERDVLLHQNRAECTPLLCAFMHTNVDASSDLVRRLIDTNHNVLHMTNSEGCTALHVALEQDQPLDVIELLMDTSGAGRSFDWRLSCDKFNQTPLHIAVNVGYGVSTLRSLMDTDKTVLLMKDGDFMTPLHIATMREVSIDIVELLLPAKEVRTQILCHKDSFACTPLMHAIDGKAPYTYLQLLIDEAGETLLCSRVYHGNTMTALCMHIHVSQNRSTEDFRSIVSILIDSERKVLLLTDDDKALPIHYALKLQCPAGVIQLLLPPHHTLPRSLQAAPGKALQLRKIFGEAKLSISSPHQAQTHSNSYDEADAQYVTLLRGVHGTPLQVALLLNASADVIEILARHCENLADNLLCELDPNGDTALCIALKNKRPFNVLSLLIDSMQNVLFIGTGTGITTITTRDIPLQIAIQESMHSDILQLLMGRSSLTLQSQNHAGQTPLHTALRHNAMPLLMFMLLGLSPDEDSVVANSPVVDGALVLQDVQGNTALHLALLLIQERGRAGLKKVWLRVMNALIDTDRRVLLIADQDDETPLHLAIGSSLSLLESVHLIDPLRKVLLMTDCYSATPLHVAVRAGCIQIDILARFVDAHEKVFTIPDVHGATPLHSAIEMRRTSLHLLTFLSGTKGQEMWSVKNIRGRTPLCCALYNGADEGIVRFLLFSLQSDADKQLALLSVDDHRCTPLHMALRRKASPCIIQLLAQEQPGVLTMFDDRMDMPLHLVLRGECPITDASCVHVKIGQFIDTAKKALLWQNEDGNTPLHIALQHIPGNATLQHMQELHLLVDADAFVLTLRNRHGHTPREIVFLHQQNVQNTDEQQLLHAIALLFEQTPPL